MRSDRRWSGSGWCLIAAVLLVSLPACGGYKKQVAESRATAHYRLGLRYFESEEVRAALNELTEAVELQPKNADYRDFLGLIHFSLGQYDLAEEQYRRVLKLNPAFTDAHLHLALVYSEQERYAEAEEQYRAALADPAYLTPERAYINWGLTLTKQDERRAAEKMFREAIAANPRYPRGHYELARLMDSGGNRAGALEEYLKAWDGGMSELPELNLRLGELYRERGEELKARIYLEKVIAVAPESTEGERARALLDDASD